MAISSLSTKPAMNLIIKNSEYVFAKDIHPIVSGARVKQGINKAGSYFDEIELTDESSDI